MAFENDREESIPMAVSQLAFFHDSPECRGPIKVDDLFLTALHQLKAVGRCLLCHKTVEDSKPLSDLYRSCPKPEAAKFTTEDVQYLRGLKVSLPNEAND